MKCPRDGTTLVMKDRQGVEIDYCPNCRGIWLDRGELEKLIEHSVRDPQSYRHARDAEEEDETGTPRKRRGSFIEDIFDF
jgi:Zn-finger nucleic acid-binding protein